MKNRLLFLFYCFVVILSSSAFGQVRNGWKSIYDKEGRLSRMNYFQDGVNINDSNFFFQYHTDFMLKGLVNGEIAPGSGCKNGNVSLFDYTGQLIQHTIKKEGSLIFDCNINENGNYSSSWIDLFDVNTENWLCDSFSVENSHLILHNKKNQLIALYNPSIKINLNRNFILRLKIPVQNNSSDQGLALGWVDNNNYTLFEFILGNSYSIKSCSNGITTQITNSRQEFENKNSNEIDLVLRQTNKDLIVQINGKIEKVINKPTYSSNEIALITRSKGNAHFEDFIFNYELQADDDLYSKLWIGKGSGFYITTNGRILTTYESIQDAKRLRVTGIKNGNKYTLPARIIREEEDLNLAVLQIDDPNFSPFDSLPFGYTNQIPTSDSKIFCVGYPNAISGIYMPLEVFEGKILPPSSSSSGGRLLELNFRNGMMGAPVFDFNFNLLGICSNKGLELRYTEMIDFYSNSLIFKTYMGKTDSKIYSPHSAKSYDEKYQAATEMVVIIESSVFDF
jgi:hypothetical protein